MRFHFSSLSHLKYSVRNMSFISLSLNLSDSRIPRHLSSTFLIVCPLIKLIPSLHNFPRFSTTFLDPNFHFFILANQLYCRYKASISALFLPQTFKSSIKNKQFILLSPEIYLTLKFCRILVKGTVQTAKVRGGRLSV